MNFTICKCINFLNLLKSRPLFFGKLSYMQLFFLVDPLNLSGYRTDLTFREFSEIMADNKEHGSIQIPLDNFYPQAGGFVGRQ